jgi:hypothetical protein
MSEMNPAAASTRAAIEVLTLWLEPDRQRAAAHIRMALGDPDGPDAASIIAGQCDLAMLLVFMLARDRGAITDDQLRIRAGEILQELSQDLPE